MKGADQVASKIVKALQESDKKKKKSYDTVATVTKVDGDKAWVRIPGGDRDTPVQRTIDAKPGDTVKVRISNKRGYIIGNGTRPPTDDTTANIANENAHFAGKTAQEAFETANQAFNDAVRAKAAAESAEADASRAATAAESAEEDANRAETAATNAETNAGRSATAAESAERDAATAKADAKAANTAAKGALNSASIVEDVVDTLNWISKHGTYTKTADTAINPDKVYFIYQNGGYFPVAEPVAEDLANYYELTINESIQNYVGTHIALTNAGLYIINDSNSYKVLLASDGMKVYDSSGALVSTFGESIVFSSSRDQTIGSTNAQITFDANTNKITIKGNVVFDGVQQIIGKADKSEIPTKTSDLTNDSNYVNSTTAQGYADAAEGRAKLVAENYITDTNQTGTGTRLHPSASSDNSIVLDTNGMEVFKGGTDAAHSVAFYGDTARIGKNNVSHIEMDYHSFQQKDIEGRPYVYFSDLRNEEGEYIVSIDFTRSTPAGRFTGRYNNYETLLPDSADDVELYIPSTGESITSANQYCESYVTSRTYTRGSGSNKKKLFDAYVYCKNELVLTDEFAVTYQLGGSTDTATAKPQTDGSHVAYFIYEMEYTNDSEVSDFLAISVAKDGHTLPGIYITQTYFIISTSYVPEGTAYQIKYNAAPDKAKAFSLGTRKEGMTVGPSSFSFGPEASATRPYSYAIGRGAEALGDNGFAIGAEATADAADAFAIGDQATANYPKSCAIGSRAVTKHKVNNSTKYTFYMLGPGYPSANSAFVLGNPYRSNGYDSDFLSTADMASRNNALIITNDNVDVLKDFNSYNDSSNKDDPGYKYLNTQVVMYRRLLSLGWIHVMRGFYFPWKQWTIDGDSYSGDDRRQYLTIGETVVIDLQMIDSRGLINATTMDASSRPSIDVVNGDDEVCSVAFDTATWQITITALAKGQTNIFLGASFYNGPGPGYSDGDDRVYLNDCITVDVDE